MSPYLISYILGYTLGVSSPGLDMFTNIAFCILYISHGTTLFIYFACNKLFRQVLIGYLKFFKLY